MDKKKAIKLATASAVAASAFVAANPNASEAATNVASVVSQAKAQFKAVYNTYSVVAQNGQLVDVKKVQTAVANADKAYANAVAVVKKSGDKKKDAYLADLDKSYKDFVVNGGKNYVKAYSILTGVASLQTQLTAAKDVATAETLAKQLSEQVTKAVPAVKAIYGGSVRTALLANLDAAKATVDGLKADFDANAKLNEADSAVKADKLADAEKALNDAKALVDKATTFKAELTAKQTKIAADFEAKNTPKVVSVSANNLKEVVIKFNQELDKDSAEKAANYTIPGNSVTAKLGEDKKTVTLTVSNTLSNNTTYEVSIKDVKTTAGKVVEASKIAFTAKDETLPSVQSVVATSYRTVEITFSEPVASVVAGDFLVDNVTPTTVTFTPNTKKVTLNFTNPLTVGEHTVKFNVNGTIKDLAGYVLPTDSQKFNVVADTTAPIAESVTINSRTEVVVKFNKPVRESTVTAVATNFKFGTTNDYNAATSKTADSVTKVDDKTYKVTFTTNPLPVGEGYFFVPANIEDLNGNLVAAKSFKTTVAADALPVVESVSSPAPNVIEVKYNKSLKAASATTRANYVLKNSAGTEVSLASATLSYDSVNNIVTITGLSLTDSSYSLTIKNVEDPVGEKVAETTKTFTVKETSAPTVTGVRWLDNADGAGKDVVIVTFDDKLATSGNYSVLNKSKWTYNGAPLASAATLEINPKNEKEVIVHLAANAANAQVISVNNVADANGNIQTTAQNVTLGAAQTELSLASATEVKIKDSKTIEFKVPRQLSSIDAVDFNVYNVSESVVVTDGTNNSIQSLTYTNTSTGATVTLTLAKALDLTKSYDVRTKPTVSYTKDSDGLVFAANTDTATATSAVQSGIKNAYVTSPTTVELVVEQPVSAIVNAADFRIVDGTKVITPQSASKNGNVITLTLAAGDALAVNATPVVKTVSQDLIQTETTNGMKLKANTEGITVNNFRVSTVGLENGETTNSATAAATDKIVITFANAVNPTALGFVSANKQTDGSYEVTDGSFVGTLALNVSSTTNDTISIAKGGKAVATLTFVQNANGNAITGADTIKFDGKLSADGKTLTLTIDSLDGSGDSATTADAVITNANFDYIKLTPGADLKDTTGNKANAGFEPTTSTKF